MKKFTSFALCFIMIAMLMTGCRSKAPEETAGPTTTTTTPATQAPTNATVPTTPATTPATQPAIDATDATDGKSRMPMVQQKAY